jgi:hypothetical protein
MDVNAFLQESTTFNFKFLVSSQFMKIDLKQGDISLPLLSDFALQPLGRSIKSGGSGNNGTTHLLLYGTEFHLRIWQKHTATSLKLAAGPS